MINLAILSGGSSCEREVSLLSTKLLLKSLDTSKYNITLIDIPKNHSTNWIKQLIENPPNIVLSALHGGLGENGAVQGFLECLNIPYVGSKVMSSSICMDKAMSKTIMRANNIPVVDDLFIKKDDNIQMYAEKINILGFPLIVKPNNGGSSIGITIAKDMKELEAACAFAKNYDSDILIEKYISGREVTCGVVQTKSGIDVLTVLDIESEFYDYNTKYTEGMSKIEMSTLPEFMQVMLKEIAKKVFVVLNCYGYGRVDMLVKEEQIYVLEMNTLPGLTEHSLIPKAVKGKGSFAEFLDSLIEFELNSAK